MGASTTLARTARKPHLCDGCHWPIAPGHRYLRHVAFPEGPMGEVNQSDHPVVSTECVACAVERESTDGLLVADACSTFCHGTLPCALPFRHGGDHSCRGCALTVAAPCTLGGPAAAR